MAAHEKELWSGVVVPNKTFFLCSLLRVFTGNIFFQSTVFHCFTKVVVAIHSLMGTVFILEEGLQSWIVYIQFIWQIFLLKAYCSFKEALAAIYSSGTSLFQETICSDLVFSRVLCFFKISICNHPCFRWYWVNSIFQFKSSIRRMALLLL